MKLILNKYFQALTLFIAFLGVLIPIVNPEVRMLMKLDSSEEKQQNKIDVKETSPVIESSSSPKKDKKEYADKSSTTKKNYFVESNTTKNDVCILVVGANNTPDYAIAQKISKVYSSNNYTSNIGFFRNSFISDGCFQKVFNGDISSFENIEIKKHTDYILLVHVRNNYESGELVEKTIVNKWFASFLVFSTTKMSVINSFELTASGLGHTKEQAYQEGLSRIMADFSTNFSKIE